MRCLALGGRRKVSGDGGRGFVHAFGPKNIDYHRSISTMTERKDP